MSNLLRSILFLAVGFLLLIRTDALAFDFVSNIPSSVDPFRFLDQPSRRLNSVQVVTPLAAFPTIGRTGAQPFTVKRPPRLAVGSNAAFWQSMQSIHTRIESLSWKQRVSDQFDGENQDGFLRALGFKRLAAADRFPADTLNAEQGSDTSDDLEPSSARSASSFGSSRILGQQPFVDHGLLSGMDLGSDLNAPLSALLFDCSTQTRQI